MTEEELYEQAEEYLQFWGILLLGVGWTFNLVLCSADEIRELAHKPAMATIKTRIGERKAEISLNKEVDWTQMWNDLELSIVHELIHAASEELDFQPAMDALLEEFRRMTPMGAVGFEATVARTWEEFIDRIAGILVETKVTTDG